MGRIAVALCALVLLGTAVQVPAAEPVTQRYAAPVDRMWTLAVAVLKQMGWDIDKEDRSIGWITTDSRRVEGEDYGVYAKSTRHRLRLNLKSAGASRTTVSVERELFKRERILWMDKEEPLVATDHEVEQALLAAIGKSL